MAALATAQAAALRQAVLGLVGSGAHAQQHEHTTTALPHPHPQQQQQQQQDSTPQATAQHIRAALDRLLQPWERQSAPPPPPPSSSTVSGTSAEENAQLRPAARAIAAEIAPRIAHLAQNAHPAVRSAAAQFCERSAARLGLGISMTIQNSTDNTLNHPTLSLLSFSAPLASLVSPQFEESVEVRRAALCALSACWRPMLSAVNVLSHTNTSITTQSSGSSSPLTAKDVFGQLMRARDAALQPLAAIDCLNSSSTVAGSSFQANLMVPSSIQVGTLNFLLVLALTYSSPEHYAPVQSGASDVATQFHIGLVPQGHKLLRVSALREEGERHLFTIIGALSGSIPPSMVGDNSNNSNITSSFSTRVPLLQLADSSAIMAALHAVQQLSRQRPQWLVHLIPALLKFHQRLTDHQRMQQRGGPGGQHTMYGKRGGGQSTTLGADGLPELHIARSQVASIRYLLKHILQSLLKIRGSDVISQWSDAISDALNAMGVKHRSLAARLSHKRGPGGMAGLAAVTAAGGGIVGDRSGVGEGELTVEEVAAKRQRAQLSAEEQERLLREEQQKQLAEIRELFAGTSGQPSLLQLLVAARFDTNMIAGLIVQNYSMFDLLDPPGDADVVFPSGNAFVQLFNMTLGRVVAPLKTDAEQLQEQQAQLRQQQELELERHGAAGAAAAFEPPLVPGKSFAETGDAAAALEAAWARTLAAASSARTANAAVGRLDVRYERMARAACAARAAIESDRLALAAAVGPGTSDTEPSARAESVVDALLVPPGGTPPPPSASVSSMLEPPTGPGAQASAAVSMFVPLLGPARVLGALAARLPVAHPLVAQLEAFILEDFHARRIVALEWLISEAAEHAPSAEKLADADGGAGANDEDMQQRQQQHSRQDKERMGSVADGVGSVQALSKAQLNKMRIPTLRKMCLERELDATGTKPALVERLLSAAEQEVHDSASVDGSVYRHPSADAELAVVSKMQDTAASTTSDLVVVGRAAGGLQLKLDLGRGAPPELEAWSAGGRDRYSRIAISLLVSLYEVLEAGDRDFAFLFLRAPVLPIEEALAILYRACSMDALIRTDADEYRYADETIAENEEENPPQPLVPSERVSVALAVLRDLILLRPSYREAALRLLLRLTVSPIEHVRDLACRLVTNKLFLANRSQLSVAQMEVDGEVLAPPSLPSNSELAKFSAQIEAHARAAFDWATEHVYREQTLSEDEFPAAGRVLDENDRQYVRSTAFDSGQGSDENTGDNVEDLVKRHTMLYFALCTKKPALLPPLARVYAFVLSPKSSPTGQQEGGKSPGAAALTRAMHVQVSQLCRQLGGNHPAVISLVANATPEALPLLLRTLTLLSQYYISTGDARPPPELVEAVERAFLVRVRDARLLVPVLAGLPRDHIEGFLPELLLLPQALIAQWVNTLLYNSQAMSAAQLMIALHLTTTEPGRQMQEQVLRQALGSGSGRPGAAGGLGLDYDRDVLAPPSVEPVPLAQQAVLVLGMCFEEQQQFTQQTLAVVLQRLVDAQPVPPLFMRTLIMTVSRFPKLIPFAVSMLGKLLSKHVWVDRRLWDGWMRAARTTFPASMPVLRQLPSAQLGEMLHAYPDILRMNPELAMGMHR